MYKFGAEKKHTACVFPIPISPKRIFQLLMLLLLLLLPKIVV
jgi:hypothetical protein